MRILILSLFYYGSVAYSAVNPVYGLLFFVHIMLFRPENLTWGTPMFGRLHMLTAVATVVGYLWNRQKYAQIPTTAFQNKNVLILAMFTTWLLVASAYAEHSSDISFEKAFDIVKILVFCFLISRLFRLQDQLMQYAWVSSISVGLLSFWGVLQGLSGNYRLEELWGVGGSNILGSMLVLMAPFIFANVLDSTLPSRSRLIFLACAVFTVLCIIYTDSRGAFLGLGIGMLMLLVQLRQRIQLLGAFVLIALLASPWLPDAYFSRIATIFSPPEQLDSSAAARPVLWRIAFLIWQDHPIMGVGLGNYSAEKEGYATRVAEIEVSEEIATLIFNQPRMPHSLYFCLLSEIGSVGLALYLILFARNAFFRLPRQPDGISLPPLYFQAKGAQAGLVGFAVAALFGDFYYIEPLYFQMFWAGAAYDVVRVSNLAISGGELREPSAVMQPVGAVPLATTSRSSWEKC